MKSYLSSAQLKDKAKERLMGHYGLLIGSSLFVSLMSFVISFFIGAFTPNSYTTAGFIISSGISFLISVFIGVFSVGTTLLYLKYASGNQAAFTDIFYGFSNQFEKSLTISLVMNAISIIPTMAYRIPYQIYLSTGDTLYLYLTIPCTALSLLLFIPLSLNFSQSFYLLLDFPDKTASEILQLSIQIMNGQKARLFYIQLSFLPLLLLGVLSAIGLLWVLPYMQMTTALFYLNIIKMKSEQRN